MVVKSVFAAIVCTGLLALSGAAMADDYRANEVLKLDLSKAALSPKQMGPETEIAQAPVEAKPDSADADLESSVWPKLPPRKAHVAKPQIAKPQAAKTTAAPARAKLAHRRNPLDAQASDTRVQTWPCKSGGICNWQR
jgi:hypothetical protein